MKTAKTLWIGAAIVPVALVVLFVAGASWPNPEATAVRTVGPVAILDTTIVDVERRRTVPHRTILVESGRIVAVGPADLSIPPGALRIDGRGKFVMPALWDMHTHVYAIAPLLDLPLAIAYGVTNVRDMQGCPKPDDPFIACAGQKQRWTGEAIEGRRVAPRVMQTTSFMANGPSILERIPGLPRSFGARTEAEGRELVRHHAAEGIRAIKVYDRLPRAAYLGIVAEAKRLGLDVVGHLPHEVSAIEAAEAGQKSIEHARFLLRESFSGAGASRDAAASGDYRSNWRRILDEHDPKMAAAIFEAMARNGTWYVPTHLTRWVDAYAEDERVRRDPLLKYLHPLLQRQWLEDVDETIAEDPSPQGRKTRREIYEKGLQLTGAAHRAGVKILAGTDYIVSGPDLHRELQQLVAAGLTPSAALESATINPALYFGLQRDYGSVAAGKVADLIILDADPLEDIRNTEKIDTVIFNGNVYDRAAREQIQELVRRRARSWTVGCRILWRFVKNPVSY